MNIKSIVMSIVFTLSANLVFAGACFINRDNNLQLKEYDENGPIEAIEIDKNFYDYFGHSEDGTSSFYKDRNNLFKDDGCILKTVWNSDTSTQTISLHEGKCPQRIMGDYSETVCQ